MTIETLGVDIAKNVFQLHGVNRNGHSDSGGHSDPGGNETHDAA